MRAGSRLTAAATWWEKGVPVRDLVEVEIPQPPPNQKGTDMNEVTAADAMEAVEALYGLVNVLHGELKAAQVMQDALLGTLCQTLPPMLDAIQDNLRGLAEANLPSVPQEARHSYSNSISAHFDTLQALR